MGRRDIQPIYSQTYHQKRRSVIILVLIGLGILVAVGLFFGHRYYEQQQLKKYPVKGVVLSQSDGYVDFEALKNAGSKFVYLKATQGAAFADDSFNNDYSRSQGAQLPVGIYHVFSFSSTAETQYKNLVSQVKSNTGSLPMAINVDYYGSYNDNNVNWKTTRVKLVQLSRKIYHYYHRAIIFWGPKDVLDQLNIKVGKKYQIWYSDGQLGKPNGDASFLSISGQPVIDMDGTKQRFNQAVFNGNQDKWEKYLTGNVS